MTDATPSPFLVSALGRADREDLGGMVARLSRYRPYRILVAARPFVEMAMDHGDADDIAAAQRLLPRLDAVIADGGLADRLTDENPITGRSYLRDLPVGTEFKFVDRHREADGSGFDDIGFGRVIGHTTEPWTAVKSWGKHRQRYLARGEVGPLIEWPGDRHNLWHHLTTVEVVPVERSGS